MVENAPGSPLAGIRVLELGQFIAGPYAGQQLADLGAEVVKVERPGHGDPFRKAVHPSQSDGYAHNFFAYNRNKLSVTIDLKHPDGRRVFKQLVAGSDVVLENFRIDTLDRLALGYDELRKVNGRLIYCAISGFSKDGPYRNRPAFDTIGQSLSGFLHLFLDADNPRVTGPTVVDQATAMHATTAIVAALFARETTDRGARIDVSMLDAALSAMPDSFAAFTESGLAMAPETRASFSHSFVFRCADDKLVGIHLGGPEHFWRSFMKAVPADPIANNPLFADRSTRAANFDSLIRALQPIFAGRPRSFWLDRMARYDVPAAEVHSIPEVLDDPEVKHSEIFETVHHREHGPVTVMRRASRIDDERDVVRSLPPSLGEHTDQVLSGAGYSVPMIAEFRAAGVI